MKNSIKPKTWVRVVNGAVALAIGVALLIACWSMTRLFDLSRADIGVKGNWVDGVTSAGEDCGAAAGELEIAA
jgi:hypothetical protein